MGITLAETVHELLTADATLMAILTGGLYLVDEPDPDEVGAGAQQNPINPAPADKGGTPDAYETLGGGQVKYLKPCGLVTTSTDNTLQKGHGRGTFVHLYFYDRLGYANTRRARERARAILHDRKVTVNGKGVELMHTNDLTNTADDTIAGGMGERPVSLERSHYEGKGRW